MRLPIRLPQTADLARHLESALAPTDELLWSGQPSGLGGNPRTHAVAIACALCTWLFAAGAVNESVGDGGFHWTLALVGGSLGALAVFALYAGLLLLVRATTIYGLTADAAIIRTLGPWGKTLLIDLKSVQHLNLELNAQDRGTIYFGLPATSAKQPHPPAFQRVRHARRIFDMARGGGKGPVESPLSLRENSYDADDRPR